MIANHSGEPCFVTTRLAHRLPVACRAGGGTSTTSWTATATRWSYFYAKEANSAAAWPTARPRSLTYDRGRRTWTASSTACAPEAEPATDTPPARVVFGMAERCLACAGRVRRARHAANTANWPDTPWDLQLRHDGHLVREQRGAVVLDDPPAGRMIDDPDLVGLGHDLQRGGPVRPHSPVPGHRRTAPRRCSGWRRSPHSGRRERRRARSSLPPVDLRRHPARQPGRLRPDRRDGRSRASTGSRQVDTETGGQLGGHLLRARRPAACSARRSRTRTTTPSGASRSTSSRSRRPRAGRGGTSTSSEGHREGPGRRLAGRGAHLRVLAPPGSSSAVLWHQRPGRRCSRATIAYRSWGLFRGYSAVTDDHRAVDRAPSPDGVVLLPRHVRRPRRRRQRHAACVTRDRPPGRGPRPTTTTLAGARAGADGQHGAAG